MLWLIKMFDSCSLNLIFIHKNTIICLIKSFSAGYIMLTISHVRNHNKNYYSMIELVKVFFFLSLHIFPQGQREIRLTSIQKNEQSYI